MKRWKSLAQLGDASILYDKEPPLFGYVLIMIVGLFLGAAVIWSIYTPKIHTVRAQGRVTNEDSNYVMCSYTGEIEECCMEEGMQVSAGDVLFTVKMTDYDVSIEQLRLSKEAYERQVSKYTLLVDSIKDDTNYFDGTDPEDELYYSTYEAYKAQIRQNELDTSLYASYGYTEEQVEAEILKNQGKISEIYYTAIQTAESAIAEANTQIISINAQLLALEAGQQAYTVRASVSGTLHLLGNYKSGMVLQTTTTVATITPQNADAVIEAYISTSDMARIQEGDSVQIAVDGLSQTVYGVLTGTVDQIDSDVTTLESEDGSESQQFRVIITLDEDYLVSTSGEKVNIVNGMTAEVRIQYDKVTYFQYVLEKLGFAAG